MADEAGPKPDVSQTLFSQAAEAAKKGKWTKMGQKLAKMDENGTKMRITPRPRSGGKQNSVEFLCVETLRFSSS